MTKSELNNLRSNDISRCVTRELVDITDITVDKTKPVADRVDDFIRAVQNPYSFRVGDVAVKISCNPNGKAFSEAVASAVALS